MSEEIRLVSATATIDQGNGGFRALAIVLALTVSWILLFDTAFLERLSDLW